MPSMSPAIPRASSTDQDPGPRVATARDTEANTNTYSQPSLMMKKPLVRCDVQPATVITPITPAAASEVSSPTASSRPAPTSVEAAK